MPNTHTQSQPQDADRIAHFLGATAKYALAPVPTPLDRAAAADYIQEHLDKDLPIKQTRRLVRLAIFYGLGDTAEDFSGLLTRTELEAEDYRRSAQALVALAWIGDPQQRNQAQQYFHRMLKRAEVPRDVAEMERVCDAFGTPKDVAQLKEWVKAEADKQRDALAEHEQNKEDDQAEIVGNRLASLEEYLLIDVPRLEQANATRSEVEALTGPPRIQRLTELYVDVLAKSTERLSFWAAMKLLRLAGQGPSGQGAIAARFEKLAEEYDRKGQAGGQRIVDLYRARCLRAKEFFGEALDQKQRDWLDKQEDAGADPLALRPDWMYAAC
ncbi:MAG: hypothetical protein GY778_14180 [bacterium]|nr:hypothetical protein [bacterium]